MVVESSMPGMSAGAVIVRRQNRYLRAFRDVRAHSPATACLLEDLSLRNTWVFRRMVRRGVFVQTDGARWYVDEQAAEAFLRGRRNRILITVVVALVVIILVLILNR